MKSFLSWRKSKMSKADDDNGGEESKAKEYVDKANKSLKKFKLFNPDKYQNALEYFEKAASLYKFIRNQSEAAKLYVRAADIVELDDSSMYPEDRANYYLLAAESFLSSKNYEEARKYYKLGAKLYCSLGNKLSVAGKAWQSAAKIEEKELKESKAAIESLTQAKKCFDSSAMTSLGTVCLESMARIEMENFNFLAAITMYTKLAAIYSVSDLMKYSVHDCIFNLTLCRLANGYDEPRKSLETFIEDYPIFSNTYQSNFLEKIISAVEERDEEKFLAASRNFNAISPFDQTKKIILLKIRAAIVGPHLELADGDQKNILDILNTGDKRDNGDKEEKKYPAMKDDTDDLC